MLIDVNLTDRPAFDETFDVCIAGAGPAGISLALALAKAGRRVALMEAGGLETSPDSQDFYGGDVVGLDYYDPFICRLRCLGGSSNHWGGRCRELDGTDFENTSVSPLDGWPIAKADLDPFAARADEILELPPTTMFPDQPTDEADNRLWRIRYRHSHVNFGTRYLPDLAASDRIVLAINANLVDLELADDLATVVRADFRSYRPDDAGFSIKARAYCLCMGGLENPRFLLNARRQIPTGIGNGHDLVGRYFSEHPHYRIADVLFEGSVPETKSYRPTRDVLAEERIHNFSLRVMTKKPQFLKSLGRTLICSGEFSERLSRHVLGRRIDCEAGGLGTYVAKGGPFGTETSGEVQVNLAQTLNPDSRILLTDDRDEFGQRRLAIDWRLNETDYRSMRTAAAVLGRYFAEQEIGRVRLREWLLAEDPVPPRVGEDMVAGYHHMCTTRMADDPAHGVVDRDCRIHGTTNLFVGGSSVFGTAGHANPTYTIVQLALRLADHLSHQPS